MNRGVPFSIREYRVEDAPLLLELFQDTIRRINSRDYCPAQIAAWTSGISLDAWTAKLASRWCVVAEMNQPPRRLGGFADLEADGHLDRFFVSADYQRCGVGGALLDAVLNQANAWRLCRIFSEVSITARPFFLSRGFRVITDQLVVSRGAAFLNYRMERQLA